MNEVNDANEITHLDNNRAEERVYKCCVDGPADEKGRERENDQDAKDTYKYARRIHCLLYTSDAADE